MATQIVDNFMDLMAIGLPNFSSDTFKIVLMQPGFTFDRTTHSGYADISGSELSGVYGYTAGGATLGGVSVTLNTTLHKCVVTWNDAAWVASGGDLAMAGAMMIDNTLSASGGAVEYIDFGGTETQTDGGTFTITNIAIEIGKVTGT